MKKLLVFLVLVGLLLFSNPSMSDFTTFVEDELSERILGEVGDSAGGRLLAGIGSGLVGAVADDATERTNFLVGSLYTIDLDGSDEPGNRWRFLGIGGQFIELENPDDTP
ncbi:MAG: hypothetical protein RhofKO_23570 [Rhodothermales bacterium]